jgi:hypothetical protein
MPKKSNKVAYTDTVFSKAVRESYNHTCQAVNIWYKGEGDDSLVLYEYCPLCKNVEGGADDCAHYYGRRYRGGRWYPDNVVALCRGIHMYIDTHESIKVDFFRRHLGDTRHDMLVERLHRNFHYTGFNRWEMCQHYKADEKRIQDERKAGKKGYIPLVSYD